MKHTISRRQFVKQTAALSASLAAVGSFSSLRANEANNKVVVAVMGTNGRGIGLIRGFLANPNVEIGYVCDVDTRAIEKGINAVGDRQEQTPKFVTDFRRALDDKGVDVLCIATPNHWHAPATILGCSAGKHVYVEKPASHNGREAELVVAAARKHSRVVQMGNQRRSWPWMIEAMEKLHAGEIGRVLFARTWYNNARGSIGTGKPAPVPEWLDYALWQGPAPDRPFKDNLIHYNWHWHWHWGNGELGNNGIHSLDIARWGLGVDYPTRVSHIGGRYHFDDDWETPDTSVVTYDFGEKGATWEGHSCHPRGFEGTGFGVTFYGDRGSMVIAGNSYKMYDMNNKAIHEDGGRGGGDVGHIGNFLDCIRNGHRPNADIEDGQKSTLLCHLGNIAYRTGRTLNIDPDTGKIVGDRGAMRLWGRDYRRGWEPQV